MTNPEWLIGIQPINWSNDDFKELGGATPLRVCLKEMQEAGYQGTELGHKFPNDDSLRSLLSEYDLQLATGWHSTYLISNPMEQEIIRFLTHMRRLKSCGSTVIIVAECTDRCYEDRVSPFDHSAEIADWDQLCEKLEQLAEIAEREGFKLAYHHHLGTVIQNEREIVAMLDSTKKVGLVLDTGHLTASGVDPVSLVQRYGSRIHHVHFKNVRTDVLNQAREKHWTFAQAVSAGIFTVPGDGEGVDFPAVINELRKVGYRGWVVVEAEQDPNKANPLEYAKLAKRFLKQFNLGAPMTSNMQQTQNLGVDFWNDSCHVQELSDAVAEGAVGATSNPVIVYNAVRTDQDRWLPVLDQLIQDFPTDNEDEIGWRLIAKVGIKAAEILYPVYQQTAGRKGFLSVQVSLTHYRNTERMVEHAMELAALAPNIAIKCPATAEGVLAMEQLTAAGVNINATVSFTVPQAIAVAEAVERGLVLAEQDGVDMDKMHPYITIMSGRVFDQLKREREAEGINCSDEILGWSGVAVFKHAWAIFQKRGYHSTLLCAAYRNEIQWSELIGPNVIQSIPHKWWTKFNASTTPVRRSIDLPVEQSILDELLEKFEDFRSAYNIDGMQPKEFMYYGGSHHTLHQFLSGYQDYLSFIRTRMLIRP